VGFHVWGHPKQALRPSSSSSSSSTSSGLDSRSGNPSISHRVGRSSRLDSKGALPSEPLSGLVDIARGVIAPIVGTDSGPPLCQHPAAARRNLAAVARAHKCSCNPVSNIDLSNNSSSPICIEPVIETYNGSREIPHLRCPA
jgi:hypothetical protein